ncbi:MAG TPA: hypothetical protein VF158_15705 [Longimicrobiales bacterium]
MRIFMSADGRSWRARVYDGPQDDGIGAPGVGWEAVLFETADDDMTQRLAYRPAGWLTGAALDDLRTALEQSEAVRARWGTERQRAGG